MPKTKTKTNPNPMKKFTLTVTATIETDGETSTTVRDLKKNYKSLLSRQEVLRSDLRQVSTGDAYINVSNISVAIREA